VEGQDLHLSATLARPLPLVGRVDRKSIGERE